MSRIRSKLGNSSPLTLEEPAISDPMLVLPFDAVCTVVRGPTRCALGIPLLLPPPAGGLLAPNWLGDFLLGGCELKLFRFSDARGRALDDPAAAAAAGEERRLDALAPVCYCFFPFAVNPAGFSRSCSTVSLPPPIKDSISFLSLRLCYYKDFSVLPLPDRLPRERRALRCLPRRFRSLRSSPDIARFLLAPSTPLRYRGPF